MCVCVCVKYGHIAMQRNKARRFVGTRGYADPTGVHEALDERSDAYSLGVVLLRLLTGACSAL